MEKKKSAKNNAKKNSKKEVKRPLTRNEIIMKALVFGGVILLGVTIVYVMYHFFVVKSDIMINMSTDKQIVFLTVDGEEETVVTQKYISDLNYSMRYDISQFRVFKYKDQDIYKNMLNETILVVVEKSTLPSNCSTGNTDAEYNNCYVKVDNFTENHYLSKDNNVYKITIKNPGTEVYDKSIKERINYMVESFAMQTK